MTRKSTLCAAVALAVCALAGLYTAGGHAALAMAQQSMLPSSKAPLPSSTPPSMQMPILPLSGTNELVTQDVLDALKIRVLGNPNAPVKLVEFASLSCPHCARFYKETFPQLKKDFIDTGKVQYTYIDFPLNGPALDAAAVALCVPYDSYFRFLDFLFATQEKWAFADNMDQILIQDGKLLGADGDKLQKCVNSKKLKSGIAERMQKEGSLFGIDSTPSFVFDDDKKSLSSGEASYDQFKKVIEQRIADKAKGGVKSPSKTPASTSGGK